MAQNFKTGKAKMKKIKKISRPHLMNEKSSNLKPL